MEAVSRIPPPLNERPLNNLQDAIRRLQNNETLGEEDLYKLSLLAQQKYGDAFPSSEDEEESSPLIRWIEKNGPRTFRRLWEDKRVGEEFRDLCFKVIKEEDKEKQMDLFKEISQRLGDGMFAQVMH